MVEPKVVAATGSATATKKRGPDVQGAMDAVIAQVSKESEEIWRNPELSQEEKNKRIAAINNDKAILDRKMKARQDAKDAWRSEQEKNSAAAKVQALKDAAAAVAPEKK